MKEQKEIELTNDEYIPLNIQLWKAEEKPLHETVNRNKVSKKFNSNSIVIGPYKPISKIVILKDA